MAFVPHFQVFSTGSACCAEKNIMEGNSVLHDREGEILTSPAGKFSSEAFKAAEVSGKCDESKFIDL